MKDEYILYLDESEARASKTFAIAGIAVKKENIHILENGIEELKKIIWDEEFITNNTPILHCTELQKIFSNRYSDNITDVKDEYQQLIQHPAEEIEKIYYQVYGRLSQIMKKADVTVFCCIIKMKQLYELFCLDETHSGNHLVDDRYNIALQKVIENYTHYLSVKDGYGDVIYESRNSTGENSAKSPDVKLINVYHKIQANNKGIVYTDSTAVQNRNRTIVVYSKNENIAGLQLADFVAYNMIKLENCNVNNQITDFMKQIHRLSYNGGHSIEEKDQRSFWGMRVLPSYLRMEELISTNKSMKNAYANVKKDRNKLKKIIDSKEEKIKSLEEQVKMLQDENKKLLNLTKNVDTKSDN